MGFKDSFPLNTCNMCVCDNDIYVFHINTNSKSYYDILKISLINKTITNIGSTNKDMVNTYSYCTINHNNKYIYQFNEKIYRFNKNGNYTYICNNFANWNESSTKILSHNNKFYICQNGSFKHNVFTYETEGYQVI